MSRALADNPFVPMQPFARWIIVSLLVLLGATIGVLNTIHGARDLPLYLSFAAYTMATILPFLMYRRGQGWFHPLIFTVLWVVLLQNLLPQIGVFAYGLRYNAGLPTLSPGELNAVAAKTALLQALGLVAMYAGYVFPRRVLPLPTFQDSPRKARVTAVALLALALSTTAVGGLVARAGGIGAMLMQRGVASDLTIRAQIGGVLFFIAGVAITANLVWLALRPEDWKRPIFIGAFIFSLAINFVATGSRSGVIVPIIMACSLWVLYRRQFPYRLVIAGALFGLLTLGVLGQFRKASETAGSFSNVKIDSNSMQSILAGLGTMTRYTTDLYAPYPIVEKVPHSVGYLFGTSYLSILAAPIPRSIWPSKPVGVGTKVAADFFGQPLNNIPPRVVGEAYWNLGVVGVVAVMGLFGMFLRWLATYYRKWCDNGAVRILYVLTLFSFQPSTPPIYQWLHVFVTALVVLMLCCGVPTGLRPRKSAPL